MEDSSASVQVWNRILGAALATPGARVDRESFLRAALGDHVAPDVLRKAIQTTPAKAGISGATIRRAAQSAMRWHRAGVTATSTLTGLPGGWWIAGTIPLDVAQYFWHVLVLVQKLAYLHGWPALLRDADRVDEETKMILTLFMGVKLGAQGAAEGLTRLARVVSSEAGTRAPMASVMQDALYKIAKDIGQSIVVKYGRRRSVRFLGRAVPIAGGILAGGTSWYSFGNGAHRLLDHLERLPLANA